MKFSSLAAPQVVKMTTCGAAGGGSGGGGGGGNFVQMTAFPSSDVEKDN